MHRQSIRCAHCGISFEAKPSARRRFCSHACHAADIARPAAVRVWSHVDSTTDPRGCWPYVGARDKTGYGRMGRGGRGAGTVAAHRVVLEAVLGRPLEGDEGACHRCDNPPCCRPTHLFVGTQADNAADMWAKGRGPSFDRAGAANGHARLTTEQVREIRAAYAAGGVSQTELARRYEVLQTTISVIVRRVRWRGVT